MKFTTIFQEYLEKNPNKQTIIFQEIKQFHDLVISESLSQYFAKNFADIKNYVSSIKGQKIERVDALLEGVKMGSKKGVASFDTKLTCDMVSSKLNKKFNHLEMLKYVKERTSKKEWQLNLSDLKGYILYTQEFSVIEYFYDDLMQIFTEKADKNHFFQTMMNIYLKNPQFKNSFIKNKKNILPIFSYAFKHHNNFFMSTLEDVLKTLKDDKDYEKIIPKESEVHILYQDSNKIEKSEVWTLDFKVMVQSFKLQTKNHEHKLAYNSLLCSFVNVLTDYGFKMNVIQWFAGRDNSKFKICILIEDKKDLKYTDVQDFLDFLSQRISRSESMLKEMKIPLNTNYDERNRRLDEMMKIELDYFILERCIPTANKIKQEIRKL